MAIFTQNVKNEPGAIARQEPMGQKIQIFQRLCEWQRVEHIPIFKEKICLPLTKDHWVTIIILNNSQVRRDDYDKVFEAPSTKKKSKEQISRTKPELHSERIY